MIYNAEKKLLQCYNFSFYTYNAFDWLPYYELYPVIFCFAEQDSKVNKEDFRQQVSSMNINEQIIKLVKLNKQQEKYHLL